MSENTPLTDLRRFYSFSRMKKAEQCIEIEKEGLLVDTDQVSEPQVRLYFMSGFFIEQEIDREGTVLANIPFRQGYRMSLFSDKRLHYPFMN